LWRQSEDTKWEAAPLPAKGSFALGEEAEVAMLRGGGCVLLARSPARVNGSPCLPLTVLGDRDEIRVGGREYYISTESCATVTEFVAGEKKVCCARCKAEVTGGERIALCPYCGSAHHEECWSYGPLCASCPQSTTGAGWRPN